MDESEAYKDTARRCEALYDYIVRDVENARTLSIHAQFVNALEVFVAFIESEAPPESIAAFLQELLNTLTAISPFAVRMRKELLLIGDENEEINTDQFDLANEDVKALEVRLEKWVAPLVFQAQENGRAFGDCLHFTIMDITEFYQYSVPALRCWKLGTPEAMSEASFLWNIDPGHWAGHLHRAILSVHVLVHLND